MFFTTDSGAQLTATVQNETRTKASFKDCERLWVSWAPGDTLAGRITAVEPPRYLLSAL